MIEYRWANLTVELSRRVVAASPPTRVARGVLGEAQMLLRCSGDAAQGLLKVA